jgi:hypothetical protein
MSARQDPTPLDEDAARAEYAELVARAGAIVS